MRETLESRPLHPPRGTSQHMCLDKGYDYDEAREVLVAHRFVAHIRSRGEEQVAMERNRKRRPRRWPVERTHSWMNRFRRLLIRLEKKLENYLALAEIVCARITFRAASASECYQGRFLSEPRVEAVGEEASSRLEFRHAFGAELSPTMLPVQ